MARIRKTHKKPSVRPVASRTRRRVAQPRNSMSVTLKRSPIANKKSAVKPINRYMAFVRNLKRTNSKLFPSKDEFLEFALEKWNKLTDKQRKKWLKISDSTRPVSKSPRSPKSPKAPKSPKRR